MSLSAHDELLMLRKRARRRLVGAIVLVLVATTVLWNVLDALPEQEMKPEQVEISGLPASAPPQAPVALPPVAASAPQETDILATLPPEDSVLAPPPAADASRPPAVVPVAPAVAVTPPAVPKAAEPKPVEPKPVAPKVADKKPEPVVAEKKTAPDPAAILEGREAEAPRAATTAATAEKYQVQLAALSDADKISALKQRLSAVGVAARFSKVQTSKGEVTRVRVGPFGSRAEADAALRKLERAGVSGIIVTK
ncbi:SPOR domain-containing protein [Vogesella indigofera]|uniref:SPOR domain-containing protein n=1 Tax=Vogesella indigofera TaxID=45465 RepID=UPI00234EB9C6|nr:SPOR domain-containing protein [Vogesella indigofera]MDC7707383.1 SPOR domain-containing protein [Vogesella indigofera]